MPRKLNLVGVVFGRLVVIEPKGVDKHGKTKWLCKCKCGNEVICLGNNLRKGTTKSCGCLRQEVTKNEKTTHGDYHERLYTIWGLMKGRCSNENLPEYKHYGGRGIRVCDDWLNSYISFKNWSHDNGYSDVLTLDRIDVNGDYEPSNCRWVTMKEQANNKTTNRFISFQGVSHTLAEWADITGIHSNVISRRLKKGWTVERALRTPSGGGIND